MTRSLRSEYIRGLLPNSDRGVVASKQEERGKLNMITKRNLSATDVRRDKRNYKETERIESIIIVSKHSDPSRNYQDQLILRKHLLLLLSDR